MADLEEGKAAPRTGDGAPDRNVQVTWRGIVDDDTPPLKTGKFVHFVARSVRAMLVALGIMRARRADGTLAPRPWGRIALIWGGGLGLLVLLSAAHIISPGSVGVPVTLGEAGDALPDGFHFTAPWPLATVVSMSTRTQSYSMSASGEGDDAVIVLGRDGGQATVDATVLFHVDRTNATRVYETLGTNITQVLVRPSARTCIRTEFTRRNVVEASTASWPEISESIETCMRDKIEPRGVTLEDFQLRDVRLSPQVQQAVETKVAADQTTGNDLSDAYLRYAYIQALRAFAESKGDVTLVLPSDGSGVQPVVPVPSQAAPTP